MAKRWGLAAAAVALLALITAAVVLATGVILLPVHTPGSKPVSLTVISRSGPLAGGPVDILAATSVEDLRSLTFAAHGPNEDICRTSECWSSITIAHPSLLIALSAPAPCRKSALNADVGPGALLTIHEVVGGWECPVGAGTLAVPSYWLLAVPLDVLPPNVLTVAFDATAGGFVRGLGGQPLNLASGSTTIDLRLPMPRQGDPVTSTAELRAAVQSARRDAQRRLGNNRLTLIGLALRRWPKGDLGCGSGQSGADLVWGSLLVFRVDTSTNVLAYEYHQLQGRTVFCRERIP